MGYLSSTLPSVSLSSVVMLYESNSIERAICRTPLSFMPLQFWNEPEMRV